MANDLWRTPPQVFEYLNKKFGFVADMAASEDNNLLEYYFTEKENSLSFRWFDELFKRGLLIRTSDRDPFVFVNPPYSKIFPWIPKAAEAHEYGIGVVMLINGDTSVGWFAEALKTVSELWFIIADEANGKRKPYRSGRLAFVNEHGEASKGNNKPQMVMVWDPKKTGEPTTKYIKKSEFYK